MTKRSVSQAHGPGAMFHEPGAAPNVGWAFMFSLTAILGAWGGGTLGQSDWTRYATKQMAPVPSQLIASPLTITVTAVIGIVVTSAARDVLGGEVIWNPIYLLAAMQEYYGSNSGVRAGVFFGGLGLVASQLAVRNGCHGRVAIGLWTGLTGFDLDFRRAQRHVLRHGHGRPLAAVHQHSTRSRHHGRHWHCHPVHSLYS